MPRSRRASRRADARPADCCPAARTVPAGPSHHRRESRRRRPRHRCPATVLLPGLTAGQRGGQRRAGPAAAGVLTGGRPRVGHRAGQPQLERRPEREEVQELGAGRIASGAWPASRRTPGPGARPPHRRAAPGAARGQPLAAPSDAAAAVEGAAAGAGAVGSPAPGLRAVPGDQGWSGRPAGPAAGQAARAAGEALDGALGHRQPVIGRARPGCEHGQVIAMPAPGHHQVQARARLAAERCQHELAFGIRMVDRLQRAIRPAQPVPAVAAADLRLGRTEGGPPGRAHWRSRHSGGSVVLACQSSGTVTLASLSGPVRMICSVLAAGSSGGCRRTSRSVSPSL